jgi:hypothetical protein
VAHIVDSESLEIEGKPQHNQEEPAMDGFLGDRVREVNGHAVLTDAAADVSRNPTDIYEILVRHDRKGP